MSTNTTTYQTAPITFPLVSTPTLDAVCAARYIVGTKATCQALMGLNDFETKINRIFQKYETPCDGKLNDNLKVCMANYLADKKNIPRYEAFLESVTNLSSLDEKTLSETWGSASAFLSLSAIGTSSDLGCDFGAEEQIHKIFDIVIRVQRNLTNFTPDMWFAEELKELSSDDGSSTSI